MKRLIRKADQALDGQYTAAGFQQLDTGGNCTAWVCDLQVFKLMVTNADGSNKPTKDSDQVLAGLYEGQDDDYLASKEYNSSAAFLGELNKMKAMNQDQLLEYFNVK